MMVVRLVQQQAAVLARGARRHDSRKSEVSAVAEDLLNASHAHKYASGGEPPVQLVRYDSRCWSKVFA